MTDDFDAEFDVAVAGAGSAGCVLAARLTENPSISLCLIEAGGGDRNPWIHIPLGFGKLVPNPKVNWGYETEPERHLNGRRIGWPRGKVLGGSGSINGLVFLRGAPSDYDAWEALGAKGWSYKDVLPYFKRMEHNVRGADAYRGQGGPMVISEIKAPSTTAKAFVEACTRLQYPVNNDFNGERIDGVGMVQLNVRKGWRCSTATGYLKPNLARKNLKPDDMRRTVAAFHIGRQIIATDPFRSLIFSEVRPGAHVVEENEIRAYLRQIAGTVYHPCGTCRMGEDDGAVVDSELRARGLEGLRVVDASVMPAIPSPNIHPATIMIAEKASDVIARAVA